MTPSSADPRSFGFMREFLAELRELARFASADVTALPAKEYGERRRLIDDVYGRSLLAESALRELESRSAVVEGEEKRLLAELGSLAGAWRCLGGGEPGRGFVELVAKTEAACGRWSAMAERQRQGLRDFLRQCKAWRWVLAALLEKLGGEGGQEPAELSDLRRRLRELEAGRQSAMERLGTTLRHAFGDEREHLEARPVMMEDEVKALRERIAGLETAVERWRAVAAVERDRAERGEEAKDRLDLAQLENSNLASGLVRARADADDLRARLEKARAESEESGATLRAAGAREEGLAARAKELEAEVEVLRAGPPLAAARAEMARLHAAIVESRAETERARHEGAVEAARSQAALGAAQAVGARSEEEASALRREGERLKAIIDEKSAALRAAAEEQARLLAVVDEKSAALRAAAEESEKRLGQAARSADESRRDAAAIKALRDEAASLRGALEAEKQNAASLARRLEDAGVGKALAEDGGSTGELLRGELEKARLRIAKLSQELESIYSSKPS